MYNLPSYGQFTKLWTIYKAMDNLQSYVQSTIHQNMYNSKVCPITKVCTIHQGMYNYKGLYNLPRYVQFTKVCSIYQDMYNSPRYVRFTKTCTIYQGMYNLPRCTIHQGM